MGAQPTRERPAGGWIGNGPPQLAAALPMPAEEGGAVAIFHAQEPAARTRRFPIRSLSFAIVVLIPVVLAVIYFFFIAADQYVAEFRFALRAVEPIRAEMGGIFQGNIPPSPVSVDSYAVVQYLGSRDVIEDLEKKLDLRAMFSRPEADWLARLDVAASIEELVRYWKNQIDAFYDISIGTIVVRARAFTPDDALQLAQGVLASAEQLVNDLSARARRDTLRNSEREVRNGERRLKGALARLREFRDREGIIDPRKTADATQALAGRIRDEIVRTDTELSTVKHYMRADAPSVRMLEARMQSLQGQLRSVESEVTDTEKSRSEVLSRVMGTYEHLESERNFAEKAYQHALEALDRARMNAERQQVYLAGFVQPSLPEEPLYPRRLRDVGVVLLLSCAAWLISAVVIQIVREHF